MSMHSSNEAKNPVLRMVPIVRGDMNIAPIPQRQLSWSDFNALQARIATLERQQQQLQQQLQSQEEDAVGLLGAGEGALDSPDNLTESVVEERYDKYKLPESAYTLLSTEDILSIPFFTGIIAAVLSFTCLGLAFDIEIDNGMPGNPLGLPAGVRYEVRMAQFLGVIIGVLMEEEIPLGLEIIGKSAEQSISGGDRFRMRRLLFPSFLRVLLGYLFLCCLFLTVVQESAVLDIFFDVLALAFVESIDDFIFGLSKRGFFGGKLRIATNKTHYIEGNKESRSCRRLMKRLIRFVYIFNACLGIAVLTYVTEKQRQGYYFCQSVLVDFGDALWENSYVNKNGNRSRLLAYSHFNGIYKFNGTHNGRPKYTEQNKEDGDEFKSTIAAEIVYCAGIESWVFRHQDISTALTRDQENECSWLLRSPSTESFDITELAEETEWYVWKGLIVSDYKIHIECIYCYEESDCNYNGKCVERACDCNHDHFGTHCQFEQPCKVIRSEKDNTTTLELLGDQYDEEGEDFVEVYGRPMYVINNLSGKPHSLLRLTYPDDDDEHYNVDYPNSTGTFSPNKHHHPDFFTDDFFEVNNETSTFQQLLRNYTFVLWFTGIRWYGQIVQPGSLTAETFKEEEYHAFWNNAFSGLGDQDNRTLIISAPTADLGSPVGVDFYEMRRRNIEFEDGIYDYDYSPFGVLIPLVEYEESGFFHCNKPDALP